MFNHPSATTGGVWEARFISEGVRVWRMAAGPLRLLLGETSMRGGWFFLINELMCFVVEIREPKIDRGLVENALLGISCVTGMAQRGENSSTVRHRINRHVCADCGALAGTEVHLSGQ